MRQAVIVSAGRTPLGKAPKGSLRDVRPDDLAALVVREVVSRTPGLTGADINDVIMGCGVPEGEQGLNLGRLAALGAGLGDHVPGMTVNRYCSSGLQTVALAAQSIVSGMADIVVAGGVESMSRVPMMGFRPSPNPAWEDIHPELYISMGHTAEEVAQRYGVSREDQDAFALESHRRAAAAADAGRFADEMIAVPVRLADGREVVVKSDDGIRRDTSLEALAKLKPVFARNGTVTAGNASQTSDGAAAVVLMSDEEAGRRNLEPLGIFRSFAVAGVAPEVMGIGPVEAVPKALERAGVRLADVDLIELNEAFAAQSLAVIRKLAMDPERVNVNGGAIALGHPLGCTGARQTATILHELRRRGGRYGLVTMCIGGGMGAAAVFEAA